MSKIFYKHYVFLEEINNLIKDNLKLIYTLDLIKNLLRKLNSSLKNTLTQHGVVVLPLVKVCPSIKFSLKG